jgi:hypothetical protein
VKPAHRKALLLVSCCLLLALVALLLVDMARPDRETVPEPDETVASSLSRKAAERAEIERVIRGARSDGNRRAAGDREPGTRTLTVRRVLSSELRERQGLPPAMTELSGLRSYRPPTAAEVRDPALRKLYQLDRRVERLRRLALHAELESARFVRDAAREREPARRAVLEEAARGHARLARDFVKQMATLKTERGSLTFALGPGQERQR